ncbi:MAG: thiamine diphosphokinase, partial [Firmicutes bacterium]|nr:thiamine diphosphokinase [Bacillota bacterium]
HAKSVGLVPHVVLGDFDSLSADGKRYLQNNTSIKVITHPPQKDKTDGHLAVEYALALSVQDIWILGGFGGRIDHTLANIFLGKLCIEHGADLHLVGNKQYVCMLQGPGEAIIEGNPGDYVSLIPLSSTAEGITTKGLAYSLKEGNLYFGDTLGVSNELTASTGEVSILTGGLLVVLINKS